MDKQTRRYLDMADGLITDMELDDPAAAVRELTRKEQADAALEELRRRLLAKRSGS